MEIIQFYTYRIEQYNSSQVNEHWAEIVFSYLDLVNDTWRQIQGDEN